jgi:fatty acid-binding protein DegV
MSGRSIIPAQVKTGEVILKGINTTLNHEEHNKAPSGHQPQEAEEEEALEEDLARNQEGVLLVL